MKLYDWKTEFDFGKFKGQTLENVFMHSHNYIHWCLLNVEWFCISNEVFENILVVKHYLDVKQKFNVFRHLKDKNEAELLQPIYDNLLQIHKQKTETFELQIKRDDEDYNYHDYSEHYDYDNCLSDAAGTDDPETMRDVYWNLD